jgi:hypothetical protein
VRPERPECRQCYWWKRRWQHQGTCWKHQVTTEEDERCDEFERGVIRAEVLAMFDRAIASLTE